VELVGFDYHDASIDAARKAAAEAGVSDQVLRGRDRKDFPGRYDLVCYFDCLHDMGDAGGSPMTLSNPTDIHSAVEEAFNARDLDGLIRLYEKDARMATPDGSVVEGIDAIREVWQGLLAMNGRMTLRTRFAVEMGDIALLRNDWSFASDDAQLASSAAEVVRRQSDGTWLYVIDHPFGSSDMIP
jgi:ketosteroid isomerase-like protein